MTETTSGDIFVAASIVPEDADLRNLHGPGRLLHYDRDFALKRELSTGTDGLVIGVAIDPTSGDIYAADAQAKTVVRFPPQGSAPIASGLPAEKIGTLEFAPTGALIVGIHNRLGEPDGTDRPRLAVLSESSLDWHDVAIDGGKLRFHCVTHLSLHPDGDTVFYVSENGRRILRYSLGRRRQLEDFLRFDSDDLRGTFGLDHLPDGRLLLATGTGAELYEENGELSQAYPIPERRGWSRLKLAPDTRRFFVNNFLDGTIEERQVEDGTLIRSLNIGSKHSLCGIDQVP